MLIWAAFAFAAEVDLVSDDAIALAAAGKCPAMEVRLERRVDHNLDDLGARLALDACRIGGTEKSAGARDLASLYHVSATFDPGAVVKGRVLTDADRKKLVSDAQLGAAMVVRALSLAKAFGDAQQAWTELDLRVGQGAAMDAARVALERAQNGPAIGWKAGTVALRRNPDSLEVLDELGLLAFDNVADAPSDALDAVFVRGRATAKLNLLYGLARGGRGAECMKLLDHISLPDDWADESRQIHYRCATAAQDLAAADAIANAGLERLDPRLRGEHAALRLAAGRPADALALVKGIEGNDARSTEVTVRALTALGRRDELTAFARGLPAGSVPRLSAAVTLFNAGEIDVARELIAGTCTSYKAENAVLCDRME